MKLISNRRIAGVAATGRPGRPFEEAAEEHLGQVTGRAGRQHRLLNKPYGRRSQRREGEVAGQLKRLLRGGGAESRDPCPDGQIRLVGPRLPGTTPGEHHRNIRPVSGATDDLDPALQPAPVELQHRDGHAVEGRRLFTVVVTEAVTGVCHMAVADREAAVLPPACAGAGPYRGTTGRAAPPQTPWRHAAQPR